MEERTFYDIHMHAFNLSHPFFRAFMARFNISLIITLTPIIAPIVGAIAAVLGFIPFLRRFTGNKIKNKINQVKNLLSVLENDTGSQFLLLEDCLRENGLLDNDGLHIDDKIVYTKYVLTPLMMDFGYKGTGIEGENFHYNQPARKPIREQVNDVFNAIKDYVKFTYDPKYPNKFRNLRPDATKRDTTRVFEIYPFIGINTKNYKDKDEIEKLLKKYFEKYNGKREDLKEKMGKYSGNIEELESNFAAGIKLYPPLDFDPWPEVDKNKKTSEEETKKIKNEIDKVKALYNYCQTKGIPITVHGSMGGFVVLKKARLKEVTKIAKWEKVLEEYPDLKINIAHFPLNEKKLWIIPKKKRLDEIAKLVCKNRNVYTDFSCRAVNKKYYEELRNFIDSSSADMQKILMKRILFGTDFAVSLMAVDSYNEYLSIFADDDALSDTEKDNFCSVNPSNFLFK